MDAETQRAHLRAVLHHQGRRARAPGSAWRPCTASSSRAAAASGSTASSARGTTFKIYLPRGRRGAAPASRRPPTRGRAARRRDGAARRGRRARARRCVAACSRRSGYRVLAARGRGRRARAVATGTRRDRPAADRRRDAADERPRARRALGAVRPAMRVLFMSGYAGAWWRPRGRLRRRVHREAVHRQSLTAGAGGARRLSERRGRRGQVWNRELVRLAKPAYRQFQT